MNIMIVIMIIPLHRVTELNHYSLVPSPFKNHSNKVLHASMNIYNNTYYMHHQKDLSLRRPLLTNSVHDRLQAAELTRVMKFNDDSNAFNHFMQLLI